MYDYLINLMPLIVPLYQSGYFMQDTYGQRNYLAGHIFEWLERKLG